MKIPVKLLSVLLAGAALFGLVCGGMALKDTMNSKSYYENMAGSGSGIDTLEDGIATLKEKEPAYTAGVKQLEEGRAAYEEGQKQLEEGQKTYDESKKLLEEKQAEYDKGVKELEAAEKKLKDAYQTLVNNAKPYEEGKALYNSKMAEVSAAQAQIDASRASIDRLKQDAINSDSSLASLSEAISTSSGSEREYYQSLYDSRIAEIESGFASSYASVNAAQAELNAKAAPLQDAAQQLKHYEMSTLQYYDGKRAFEAAKKQLEEGKAQLDEGWAKLEEAGKELEAGKAKLAEAKKQLEDGEKQLAAFEEDRTQVIAGLNTAMATGDVAERLGADFNFMRDKENLDYEKSQYVVDAARAYADNLTAAVTKELSGKAVASGATIAASALALIASIFGFVGKAPALGGCSIGTLIAGAIGAFFAFKSGDTYSAAAGATSAGMLLAGGAVNAVVGLLGSLGGFGAKKKEPVA